MNLKEFTDGASSDVIFANFNQDCTALSVGSNNVIRLYSLQKVDKLEVTHGIVAADVLIIERHFRSDLVALVTVSDPWRLKIVDITKECELSRYSYHNPILAVKLNDLLFMVCLEDCVIIQSFKDIVTYIQLGTPPNPLGLCVLSQNTRNNIVAYPGSSSGEVIIYDTFLTAGEGKIVAHKNPLEAMAFNATATKIATASDRGTVIRVFDVTEMTKLYEFRPGVTKDARIYLCFSEDSKYLSSSSNTETVHIFRLDDKREEASALESQGWISYLTNVMVGLIPQGRTAPTSMLCADRAFATVCLPFSGIRNICGLAEIEGSLRVLIFSGQSILYIYNVDSVNGGECVLEHTYNLSEWGSSVPESKTRFRCVEGIVQYQKAPSDSDPYDD